MYDFSSVFFLSLATMTFGFCAGALGYALKSKCSRVKCCCVEIIRDVELEADIEEKQQPKIETQTSFDHIPNAPNPTTATSRRSSVRRSYNLSEIAKASLEAEKEAEEKIKETKKDLTIDFSKSMI